MQHPYWATLNLKSRALRLERLLSMLKCLSSEVHPHHFSKSERLRRSTATRMDSTQNLRLYLAASGPKYFHGDRYLMCATAHDKGDDTLELYSSCARALFRLTLDVSKFFCQSDELVYGNAAVEDEYRHRNGYYLQCGDKSVSATGWMGRNYRWYVPGLYWVNVFSSNYITVHGLDIEHLAIRLQGSLQRIEGGLVLVLYSEPGDWVRKCGEVDGAILERSAFFSRARVPLPEVKSHRDAIRAIQEIGMRWP